MKKKDLIKLHFHHCIGVCFSWCCCDGLKVSVSRFVYHTSYKQSETYDINMVS